MIAVREPAITLSDGVVNHLDAQIGSARRLLAAVLAQGTAIRAQDVEGVLSQIGEMKSEMAKRAALEGERSALLELAGSRLGVPAAAVTLEALVTLMAAPEAARALVLSSELKGLLAEITRVHGVNRALMRQELAFLDHLVRLIGQEPEAGYNLNGGERGAHAHHVLDTQA
ncbi:MAG: hypothetical protein NVSMB25_16790 [Thermoleophilaceae bacterium]